MMRFDEFTCEARVRFAGKDLALNKIISRVNLDDIAPPPGPILDPSDLHYAQEASERRRRFIDMLASEFAHALTEALYERR